jgi:hypothetical protein
MTLCTGPRADYDSDGDSDVYAPSSTGPVTVRNDGLALVDITTTP